MSYSGSTGSAAGSREVELRRLASIVEDSDDAIVSKDLTGRITSWNRAAEQMFGYAAEDIIGQPVTRLFPDRLVGEEASILDRLRLGERIEQYETVRIRKDGREIDVAVTISPIRNLEGQVVGASKILRDVTEAKRLRREHEELRRELMHVSRLNDMGQMATAFAHELNQPLSAIRMYLAGMQRLLEQGELGRAAEACTKSIAQVERIAQVVQRLRNFVIKREAERQPEELRAVVEEAAALALMDRFGIALTVEIGEGADMAAIDRVQVQQVLLNLIRNAAEAMAGRPHPAIWVATRRVDPDWVEVVVADSGPGLAPSVLERLFQPFITTKPEGMGVGLSLCRTMIESGGGQMHAGNAAHGGAEFRFTLPAE